MDAPLTTLATIAAAGWSLLNSDFAIAFLGGLTGAVGGALGAQRIVERTRKREELLRELRYTNAAIMVSFSVCNAALSLKKQHVKPMREEFIDAKAKLQEFKAKRQAGKVSSTTEFEVKLDMRTYPAPVVPLESLKHMVFQEISVTGRPLALVAVIEQSLIGVTKAIAKRDLMIQKFASGAIPENLRVNFYFGLALPGGHRNEEFADLVEAVYSYVDDIAFFSSQLCVDLMEHGKSVRAALLKKSRKQVPKVSEVDFTNARASELMPLSSRYLDWLNAFVEQSATDD